MDKLLELQPKKDVPFNKIGRGNTGYLFDVNKAMYEYIIGQTAAVQKNDKDKKRIIALLNPVSTEGKTELEVEMDVKMQWIMSFYMS